MNDTVEHTKRCNCCGKVLPLGQFKKSKGGSYDGICLECVREKVRRNKEARRAKLESRYSDEAFEGMTPREVQEILARAARWLNNYGGFTCEVSLRYEKEIKLDVR